jgi:hypothetical protein
LTKSLSAHDEAVNRGHERREASIFTLWELGLLLIQPIHRAVVFCNESIDTCSDEDVGIGHL